MEVIGMGKDGKYICEVGHTELEKFLGTYYGKTQRLKVGDAVDLGRGYDFSSDIEDAMGKTSDLITSNRTVIEAILNGIKVVNNKRENQPV